MISASLTLRLVCDDGTYLPLETELQYSTSDPLAITALFDTGEGEPVRWVFARDLLANGLDHRVGEGDISVWPALDDGGFLAVRLQLQSPDGAALIDADSADIERFLAKTWKLIPQGGEIDHLGLDRVLELILDDV
jgi:hypothetical protein